MKLSRLISYLSVFFMLSFADPSRAIQMEITHINILADPSLSVPISEIARSFSSKNSTSITTSYASARAQSDSIIAGLEADVFITTRKQTLEALKVQGLVDVYSQKEVTKNNLSMVTYGANSMDVILMPKLPLKAIFESVDPDFTFAIGDPEFQNSGFYAMRALRSYEMAGNIEPNMLFVRSATDMHKVIGQKGGYGIVYTSEAKSNSELKTLGTFPESAHTPIIYHGVAVAGENMDAARKFLEFLGSDTAQDIFIKHGFESMKSYRSESGHLARGSTFNESISPL